MSTTTAIVVMAICVALLLWFLKLGKRDQERIDQHVADVAKRVAEDEGGVVWHESGTMRDQPFNNLPEFRWAATDSSELAPVIQVDHASSQILVFWVKGTIGASEVTNRVYAAIRMTGANLPRFYADPWRPLLRKMIPRMASVEVRVTVPRGGAWRLLVEDEQDLGAIRSIIAETVCDVVDQSRACQFLCGEGEWLLTGGAEWATEQRFRDLVHVGRKLSTLLQRTA